MKIMTEVQHLLVQASEVGQRLDNYLFKRFKEVPKSRLYRAFRNGEIRANKKRVKPDYRVQANDDIRLPPLMVGEPRAVLTPTAALLQQIDDSIIYEDEALLVLNKPVGLACHGGSGLEYGLIDVIKQRSPEWQLVHRLDKDTSGCLFFAKSRELLLSLQQQIQQQAFKKTYLAWTLGRWATKAQVIELPLLKVNDRVIVSPEGKSARTEVRVREETSLMTLVEANLMTGRTHQLRVHFAAMGHPIIGDSRYGDREGNRQAAILGMRRLCLHALQVECHYQGKRKLFVAPPDAIFIPRH